MTSLTPERCRSPRYEAAQTPFHRNNLPAPALVFTVLLSSDPRLNSIHAYHRANGLVISAGDLAIHMSTIEADLAKDASLLSALEEKLVECQQVGDELGLAFWGDRIAEKRKNVKSREAEQLACKRESRSIQTELDSDPASVGAHGISLRRYAEKEEKEEMMRQQNTLDELAAWRAGNDLDDDRHLFPPLETLLQPPPPPPSFGRFGHHHRRHHGRFGHFGGSIPPFPPPPPGHGERQGYAGHHLNRHSDGVKTFIDRVSDVVQNRSPATSLVPSQEIKSMLDNFLVNLSNQLATTFDGAPAVASTEHTTTITNTVESEPVIPGAFVVPQDKETPVVPTDSTEEAKPIEEKEKEKAIKPSSKLGKGGFRHKHISCDGCLTGIRGMRYECEVSEAIWSSPAVLTLAAMLGLRFVRLMPTIASHIGLAPKYTYIQGYAAPWSGRPSHTSRYRTR